MKQKLKLVTPLSTEDVNKKENTIITNGVHNAAYSDKIEALKNVLPMTEVGIGIALSDIKSVDILGALNKKKIAQIRDIMTATRAWHTALVQSGMDDIERGTYSGRLLGLAPAMIASLGLDDDKSAVVETYLRQLWDDPRIVKQIVDTMAKMPKVTKIKNYQGTKDLSINTLPDVLNFITEYFRTDAVSAELSAVISSINDETVAKINESDKKSANDVMLVKLIGDKNFAPLFSTDIMSLYLEIFVTSRVVGKKEGLANLWNTIVDSFKEKFSLGSVTISTGTSLPFIVWVKIVSDIIESDKFRDAEWADMNVINSTAMRALKTRYSQNLVTKASDGITELYKALNGLQTFSQSLSDFYSNKTGFVIESYKNTEKLVAGHKKFLSQIAAATDVSSAREAFQRFAQTPDSAFTQSLAGLLFAIINNQDSIDPLLVSDILGISINEDVIKSFRESPFGKDISLSTVGNGRINDFGSGVSGFTLKGEVNVHTKVVFEEDGNVSYNGHKQTDINQIFLNPFANKDNQSAFCKMAMLLIGNPDVHSKLNGLSEISTYADEYAYSKAVRDEMLPTIRLINNCVGIQMFAYKTASLEWLKQQQFGVIDMVNYVVNYLDSEKNNIKTRLYSDVTVANLIKIRDVAKESLKTLFSIDVPEVPKRALPYVSFYIGGSTSQFLVTDIDVIITHMITTFRRPTHDTLRVIEEMKSNLRAINALSKEGVNYKRTNNPMYIKASLFAGFGAVVSVKPVSFDITSFNSHLAFRPNHAHIRAYKSDAFRDDEGMKWFQGGSLPLLLDNVLANKRNLTDLSEISGDRFGAHARDHFKLNPYIIQYAKIKASDLLNKVYLSSFQSTARSARAMFQLNHLCQALLKISPSPYEGLEYGFSPSVETFTTTSNRYSLEYILSSVGIKADAQVLTEDGKFFYMIQQIGRAGGPVTLTEVGESVLGGSFEGKNVTIADAVGLSPAYTMNTSSVMTLSFYLRTPEMMSAIYNDFLIEDISKSYDIMLVEDNIITALKSSSFDDMILTLGSEYPLDLTDIETESDIRSALQNSASTIADFLFPFGETGGAAGKKEVKEEEEEEETKE